MSTFRQPLSAPADLVRHPETERKAPSPYPNSSRAIHEQCLRLMGDERDARTLRSDIEDGGHY